MMSASENIKRIRNILCIDQRDLSEELGLSQAAISLYERGKRIPRIQIIGKLKKLAKKANLKVTTEDFFE